MLLGIILAAIAAVLLLAAMVGIYEYIRGGEFGLALLALIFAIIPGVVCFGVGIQLMR